MDRPQVAGAAGVTIVFAKIVKLLILPDISQALIQEIAHFRIG